MNQFHSQFVGILLLIGCTSCNSVEGRSLNSTQSEAQKAVTAIGLTKEERAERWQKYNTPGDMHQQLDVFVGEWEATWTVWESQGAKPIIGHGRASFNWANGGRYVRASHVGEIFGHEYDVNLMLGYDIFREEYVGHWTNSFQTAPLQMRAKPAKSESGVRSFNFVGKADDCTTGRFDLSYRIVFEVLDNPKFPNFVR